MAHTSETNHVRRFLTALTQAAEQFNEFNPHGVGHSILGSKRSGYIHIYVESFADSQGVQLKISCQRPREKNDFSDTEPKDRPLFKVTRKTIGKLLEAAGLQEDVGSEEDTLPTPGHYHQQIIDNPDFSLYTNNNIVTPRTREYTLNQEDLDGLIQNAESMLERLGGPLPEIKVNTNNKEQQHIAPARKLSKA